MAEHTRSTPVYEKMDESSNVVNNPAEEEEDTYEIMDTPEPALTVIQHVLALVGSAKEELSELHMQMTHQHVSISVLFVQQKELSYTTVQYIDIFKHGWKRLCPTERKHKKRIKIRNL